MGKLTATKVKSITEPGRYGDGDGLYLYVTPAGTKSWVQRITVYGRRHDLGLGSVSTVPLAQARDLAHANRVIVAKGGDPLATKRREHIPTFREAAKKAHAIRAPGWSEKYADDWMHSLERYAMDTIGDTPVDRIKRVDVLQILDPIWTTKSETARRVRTRIRLILGWAQAHGYVEHNAAGEAINAALPPMPKTKRHFRSMTYLEVSEALRIVDASGASTAAKCCLRFQVLTAARPGEARGALWSEIDVDSREWRLPPERMKAGEGHRVPLSGAALDVLDTAKTLHDGSDLVFPSPLKPGRPLSNMTVLKVLRDCGLAEQTTAHGFRSSFRTWALEKTTAPWAVAEAALAHRLGNSTEQAYVRGDLFEARRELMDAWAEYLV